MKTFIQWAEEKKLDLPVLTEKTSRGGIAYWAYPSAYSGRGYARPDLGFMAGAADAGFKMGYASSKTGKKPNDKSAPGETPG